METVFLILALLVMVLGLVGAVLPMIPSVPMVYAGFVLYGLATEWRDYGLNVMVFFGLLTCLIIAVDYVAGAVGAKKFGASPAGVWGSIIGAVAGVIIFNVFGLIIGTFAGAIIGELLYGRDMRDAVRSGWGAFMGFLAGSFFKIMTSLAMIASFLWLVIF